MTESPQHVTQLLLEWSQGDADALNKLTPIVYRELRHLAEHYLHQERAGHTLQPTALVHEAYLRLVHQSRPDWKNRTHFFAVSARLMRQILVDHARHHRAAKRDGGQQVPITDNIPIAPNFNPDVIALDDLLRDLERIDPRKLRIVELRYFAGLTVEETAQAMDVSESTVHRELKTAETWLYRKLNPLLA